MNARDFWADKEKASQIISEFKEVKNKYEAWMSLSSKINDVGELLELSAEDASILEELNKDLASIRRELEDFEIRIILSGKFDKNSAILNINAGAGGTEACDWAGMVFRMYSRWAEKKNYRLRVTDILSGDEAGIKNITFLVEGSYAYGYLKSERGVHRLVRISPFDANRRRHTSFVSVDVIPQIGKEIDLNIDPKDLKIETFRASGHGGQHVNMTDSAVRIIHLPTGISAQCQNERSQFQNKQMAMAVLKSRLYKKMLDDKKKEIEGISGEKSKIEWGSQIRSYVLHPYLMVKDHRTNAETSNANAVLDGDLDLFINSFLKKFRE